MKISTILFSLIFISVYSLNAQTKYEIKETEQNIRKGFEVMLPGSIAKDADQSVRDFLKAYKAKVEYTDKNKMESMALQTLIPSIQSAPVDLYFNVIAIGTDSKLYIYFNIGDMYVTSKAAPEKFAPTLSIVNQLVGKIASDKFQYQVDSVFNNQKSLEKEYSGLEGEKKTIESSIEKNKKTISDNELKIKENERSIEKSKLDQSSLLTQMNAEKVILASMNPDALRDRMKTLEDEIKDLQKNNQKSNDDIASKKGKIAMLQSSIVNNKTQLESNKKQIETIDNQKKAGVPSGIDPKMLKEQIKVLSDQQKEIEKSNEKLLKDNVKSEGDIQSTNSEILTINNQIQTNQTNIQSKSKEKTDIEQKISNNSLDDRMKKVEEMQKTYEKLQKEQEKMSKDIDLQKVEIEKLKQENLNKELVAIPDNQKLQAAQNIQMEKVKADLLKVKSIQQSYLEMK